MARRLELNPRVGAWFTTIDGRGSDARFEVVAFDAEEGTVELQYFDGTVEEMDLEDWNALANDGSLRPAQPPEDYSGSVDVEHEDLPSIDDTGSHHVRALHDGAYGDGYDGSGLRASALDGLDIFE